MAFLFKSYSASVLRSKLPSSLGENDMTMNNFVDLWFHKSTGHEEVIIPTPFAAGFENVRDED